MICHGSVRLSKLSVVVHGEKNYILLSICLQNERVSYKSIQELQDAKLFFFPPINILYMKRQWKRRFLHCVFLMRMMMMTTTMSVSDDGWKDDEDDECMYGENTPVYP